MNSFGLIIGTVIVVFVVGRRIYWRFDHSGWDPTAVPDPNAVIIGSSSEKVEYKENGAKFKTTVSFSDGFYYITHRTKRKNDLLTYTISIDNELKAKIYSLAAEAHDKAIRKYFGKTGRKS